MSTSKRESRPHLRVFVVENHPATLRSLTMFLKSLGHTVTAAERMGEALAAIPSTKCDVFISDIGLEDGTGWDLMQQANFQRPVYAVAVSGFGTPEDIERSKAAGFRHHLVKPIGGEDLKRILDEAAREIQTARSNAA